MKKIKYLLFFLPFLFSFNVFAQNVTSSVRCTYSGSGSSYYGDPNDGFNSARCYDLGSRYSPRLGYIEFYLPTSVMSFTAGKSYTVTMNMASNDWRNNIMLQHVRYVNNSGSVITSSSSLPSMSNFRFISKKQIKFDFKLPSGTIYPYLRFVLSSPTYGNPNPDISSSTYMTGDSNWNLSSIDITPVSSSSGSSSGGSSSGSSYDDSGVINNNNQNTTDIINNNNQNTTDIINNNNNNTNIITNSIDSVNQQLGSCYTNLLNQNDKFITNERTTYSHNGNTILLTSSGWGSAYLDIPLKKAGSYTVSIDNNLESGGYLNVYYVNSNGERENWLAGFSSVSQSSSFTINKTNGYIRIILGDNVDTSGTYTFWQLRLTNTSSKVNWVQYGNSVCTSKLDDTNRGINEINDNLTDETVPDIDLNLDINTNSPVSDLLTMPLTILNKVFDITDDTCEPYILPFDFSGGNNTLTLPCIDLKKFLGNTVYNVLDTILCFYLCYQIGMMCVSIYEDITSLRDGFYGLYTPKHHDTSTRVGRGEMEGKY